MDFTTSYVLCLLFFFFFFFKQKTAYEMRISDWSSDVCSSDLVRCVGSRQVSPVVQGYEAVRLTLRAAVKGIDIGWVAVVTRTPVEPTESPEILAVGQLSFGAFKRIVSAPVRHRKIGRASCRERVCKYV